LKNKHHPLKRGDRITFSSSYGTGYTFGINKKLIDEVREFHKFLTVTDNMDEEKVPIIYMKEVQYFWPAFWFKKIEKQLEFDFNASI
jgi:hypothetical protein